MYKFRNRDQREKDFCSNRRVLEKEKKSQNQNKTAEEIRCARTGERTPPARQSRAAFGGARVRNARMCNNTADEGSGTEGSEAGATGTYTLSLRRPSPPNRGRSRSILSSRVPPPATGKRAGAVTGVGVAVAVGGGGGGGQAARIDPAGTRTRRPSDGGRRPPPAARIDDAATAASLRATPVVRRSTSVFCIVVPAKPNTTTVARRRSRVRSFSLFFFFSIPFTSFSLDVFLCFPHPSPPGPHTPLRRTVLPVLDPASGRPDGENCCRSDHRCTGENSVTAWTGRLREDGTALLLLGRRTQVRRGAPTVAGRPEAAAELWRIAAWAHKQVVVTPRLYICRRRRHRLNMRVVMCTGGGGGGGYCCGHRGRHWFWRERAHARAGTRENRLR